LQVFTAVLMHYTRDQLPFSMFADSKVPNETWGKNNGERQRQAAAKQGQGSAADWQQRQQQGGAGRGRARRGSRLAVAAAGQLTAWLPPAGGMMTCCP
jgi:hypothetical protein